MKIVSVSVFSTSERLEKAKNAGEIVVSEVLRSGVLCRAPVAPPVVEHPRGNRFTIPNLFFCKIQQSADV